MSQKYDGPKKRLFKHSHMAGIVPLIVQETDVRNGTNPLLLPIASGFTISERAIVECSRIGCDSIWVICPPDTPNELRYRLGDWIVDPVTVLRNKPHITKTIRDSSVKYIPIFYVAQEPLKDQYYKNLLYNIFYAAKFIFDVNSKISYSMAPTKFFVSFPWSTNCSYSLLTNRINVATPDVSHHFEYKGKSILAGNIMPFTFLTREQPELLQRLYDCRQKKLADQFKEVFTDRDSIEIQTRWSYEIVTWEDYRAFLSDKYTANIRRPKNHFYRQYLQDPFKEINSRRFSTFDATSLTQDERFNVDALDYAETLPEVKQKIDKVKKKKFNSHYDIADMGDEIRKILQDTDYDFDSLVTEMNVDTEGEVVYDIEVAAEEGENNVAES